MKKHCAIVLLIRNETTLSFNSGRSFCCKNLCCQVKLLRRVKDEAITQSVNGEKEKETGLLNASSVHVCCVFGKLYFNE